MAVISRSVLAYPIGILHRSVILGRCDFTVPFSGKREFLRLANSSWLSTKCCICFLSSTLRGTGLTAFWFYTTWRFMFDLRNDVIRAYHQTDTVQQKVTCSSGCGTFPLHRENVEVLVYGYWRQKEEFREGEND